MFNSIKELRHAGNKARVTHFRYVKMREEDLIPTANLKKEDILNRIRIVLNGGITLMRHDQIREGKLMNSVLAKGGITKLEVTTKDRLHITTEAVCCKKDNYNKVRGVKIAMGRLHL